MRIRYPFAGAFAALVLIAGYLGFSTIQVPSVDDKALHFAAFFLLTVTGYWALDLPRRILLKLIFFSITLTLSVVSEVVQGLLPNNGRTLQIMDIAANFLGSTAALALCAWYHKRMLERRRRRKYGLVGSEEGDDDIELGEGSSGQELGVIAEDDDDDGGEAWDTMDGDDNANGEAEAGKTATQDDKD